MSVVHWSHGLLALIELYHGLQGYNTGVCFVTSNARSKEKKNVLAYPLTSQRLLEGKFYFLYEDMKT
jgi:hypothetical protein